MAPRPWDPVLSTWFGAARGDPEAIAGRKPFWFGGDGEPEADRRARDEALSKELGELAGRAARGELASWAAEPRGRLALILLLDQLPRNLHRGTARAFATDSEARRLCEEGLALGQDQALAPIERAFFYMPLEHAEDREAQARCVALFEALAAAVPEDLRDDFEEFAHHARMHRDIVERFGRFPHRNEVLGRESTSAERESLARSGRRFGQAPAGDPRV